MKIKTKLQSELMKFILIHLCELCGLIELFILDGFLRANRSHLLHGCVIFASLLPLREACSLFIYVVNVCFMLHENQYSVYSPCISHVPPTQI